ncbi:MAG: dTDP-4-dehydrorhamnose reductase [Syntrophales bacterium]|nr:dTDP-4-dehydrorhamnose reductase [Syntrophales bacterium]
MKILILGHRGMLGSDLTKRLSIDYEVTGIGRDYFDITSLPSCEKILREAKPDIVINAVAYTDVDKAENDRENCFQVNTQGVKHLAMLCGDKAIPLVHFSTDYVFDGTKSIPYTEEDTPNPVNVYGLSKAAGEKYIVQYCKDFLIIRTAWLYGQNGRNFVKTILEMAQKKKNLRVVSDQFGSPTWTWDLAGAVKLLLEGNKRGIFHITNRGSCSWYEFAKKILAFAGVTDVQVEPISSVQLNRPARRPQYSVLSNRKFAEATGKTLRFWQFALEEFLKKFTKNFRVNTLPH